MWEGRLLRLRSITTSSATTSGGSLSHPVPALLSRSVITENSTNSVSNQGTIYTYQDNRIYLNGNSNAVSGNALAPITGQ